VNSLYAEPCYIIHVKCYSADDLLNVRLQTLGIAEHRYHITLGGDRYSWLMYDVGGAVRVLSYQFYMNDFFT
jgi:hypothetical protein